MTKKFVDSFVVVNVKGLHTRPSTEIVKCATSFCCRITLHSGGVSVNAKSLLGILMLAAARGTEVTVEAEGEDAEEAVKSIVDLASHQFYIKY
jgi:phosphocarrier protein